MPRMPRTRRTGSGSESEAERQKESQNYSCGFLESNGWSGDSSGLPFPSLSFLLFQMLQGSLMEELPLAILQDRQLLGELWRVGPGRMEVLARAIARRRQISGDGH